MVLLVERLIELNLQTHAKTQTHRTRTHEAHAQTQRTNEETQTGREKAVCSERSSCRRRGSETGWRGTGAPCRACNSTRKHANNDTQTHRARKTKREHCAGWSMQRLESDRSNRKRVGGVRRAISGAGMAWNWRSLSRSWSSSACERTSTHNTGHTQHTGHTHHAHQERERETTGV